MSGNQPRPLGDWCGKATYMGSSSFPHPPPVECLPNEEKHEGYN